MATCSICSNAEFFLELSCGCNQYCQTCIQEWFREQITGEILNASFLVLCPASSFRHELTLQEVLEVVKGSEYEAEIEETILKRTLRGMREMNFCPRVECDYVGWVDLEGTCSDPVECEKCGEKWKIIDLLPKWSRRFRVVKGIFTGEDDALSILWKDISTKSCPWCGVHIENTGWCSSMICIHCRLSFCWNCMKSFRNHKDSDCNARSFVWISIYLFLGLLLPLKLSYIAGVAAQLFYLLALAAITLVALIAMPLAIAVDMYRCNQLNFLLWYPYCLVYIFVCVLVANYTELGAKIWDYELALIVAALHCSLGLVI